LRLRLPWRSRRRLHFPWQVIDPGPAQQKEEAEKRKSEAERNAGYEQGGPVAGHDFRRERAQKMGLDE
jgi:hypothetical protein